MPEVVLMPEPDREPITLAEMKPNVIYRNVGTSLHPRLVPMKLEEVKPCEMVYKLAEPKHAD